MIDQEIRELIKNSAKIGITSHVRPDGDAIGSVLGLGLALQNSGKVVEMVLEDGVSSTFRHLPGAKEIKKSFTSICDLYFVVDASELSRIGDVMNDRPVDIVIDHHITNPRFGKVNLIDADAVATCAILAEHLPAFGLEITQPVAANLLSGILSDSIGFRTSNTSARTLRVAADLMEKGANISELYNKALISRSFEAANYWGYALGRLEHEDGLVWTALTLEDRKSSKYPGNDDADLTNILSSIDGMDIAVLFVEQTPEMIKISWRSRPGVDVSSIAASFGGGGHAAAAGAEIHSNMEVVKEQVLAATRKHLDQLRANNTIPEGGEKAKV